MNSLYGVAKDVATDVAGKISNYTASLGSNTEGDGESTVESKPEGQGEDKLVKKAKSFSMSIDDVEEVRSTKKSVEPEPENPPPPVLSSEADVAAFEDPLKDKSSDEMTAAASLDNEEAEDFDPWAENDGGRQVMNSKFRNRRKSNDPSKRKAPSSSQ